MSTGASPALARGGDFTGDGRFIGDGSQALEQAWKSSKWRAIPKCDGRYVCRERGLAMLSLHELCSMLRLEASSPVVQCCDGSATKDAVYAIRLVGGGGLLTYAKLGGTYVHTLNTESGLCRKLVALDCVDQLISRLPREDAIYVSAFCRLLEEVKEGERTLVAPALSSIFRFHVLPRRLMLT